MRKEMLIIGPVNNLGHKSFVFFMKRKGPKKVANIFIGEKGIVI